MELTGGPLRGRSPACGTSVLSDGLGVGGQKINIRSGDQLIVAHAKLTHDVVCDSNAIGRSLALIQDNFKLHEIAQALNLVEVNPGVSNQEEKSFLSHATVHAKGMDQCLAQRMGRLRWNDGVLRFFGLRRIGSLVVD